MFVTEKHEEHQLSKNSDQPTDERRLIHLHIPQIEKKNILKEMSLDFTYNQVKHRGDTVELKYLYQREKLKKKESITFCK